MSPGGDELLGRGNRGRARVGAAGGTSRRRGASTPTRFTGQERVRSDYARLAAGADHRYALAGRIGPEHRPGAERRTGLYPRGGGFVLRTRDDSSIYPPE